MQQDIPSYAAIMDTLRRAEQGYVVGPEGSLRPMPWRRILDYLAVLGPDELLHIAPGASGIAVRHVVVKGRAGARPSGTDIPQQTVCTVGTREGLRARARFAQRIEMAVRSGECREVTCLREGSRALALTADTGATEPQRGNGLQSLSIGVHGEGSRNGVPRPAPSRRRHRKNRYGTYLIVAASLLLSVVALASAVARLNEDSPPPPSTNAMSTGMLLAGVISWR